MAQNAPFLFRFSPSLLALMAALLWLATGTAQASARQAAAPLVTVTQVEQVAVVEELSALGTLSANRSITITPQIDGRVTELNLVDGGQVQQGDLLVQLDNREQAARTAEVRISLADAERQLSYMRALFERRAISEDELKAQQAQVQLLTATLSAEEAVLDYYAIQAPFSGQLSFHDLSTGAWINVGTEITTLDDLDRMKLTFELPEQVLSLIQPGARVVATSDAWPDQVFTGQVQTISPRIDPLNLSVQVRALIDNPEHRLLPGMLMRLRIERPALTQLLVPARSVLFSGSHRYVYVLDADGRAERREIKTGATQRERIAVLSGLVAGERVIDQGVVKVADGRPVRLKKEAQLAQPEEPGSEQSDQTQALAVPVANGGSV